MFGVESECVEEMHSMGLEHNYSPLFHSTMYGVPPKCVLMFGSVGRGTNARGSFSNFSSKLACQEDLLLPIWPCVVEYVSTS